MKDFIRELVKVRLNEVATTCHFMARKEERVWGAGSHNVKPATINKAAHSGEAVAGVLDIKTCDEDSKKSWVEKNVPVTTEVKTILGKIDKLENEVEFDTYGHVALILWKSSQTHGGGKGWGDTLVAVLKNNELLTLAWYTRSGLLEKEANFDLLIPIDTLFSYINQTDSVIDDYDLETLIQKYGKKVTTGGGKKKKRKPKKTDSDSNEIIYRYLGTRYVVNPETYDLTAKNSGKVVKFDELPDKNQEEVFSLIP